MTMINERDTERLCTSGDPSKTFRKEELNQPKDIGVLTKDDLLLAEIRQRQMVNLVEEGAKKISSAKGFLVCGWAE